MNKRVLQTEKPNKESDSQSVTRFCHISWCTLHQKNGEMRYLSRNCHQSSLSNPIIPIIYGPCNEFLKNPILTESVSTIYGYLQLSTIRGYLLLSQSILNYHGLSYAVLSYLWLSIAVSNYPRLSGTIYGYLPLSQAILHYPKLPLAILYCLGLSYAV